MPARLAIAADTLPPWVQHWLSLGGRARCLKGSRIAPGEVLVLDGRELGPSPSVEPGALVVEASPAQVNALVGQSVLVLASPLEDHALAKRIWALLSGPSQPVRIAGQTLDVAQRRLGEQELTEQEAALLEVLVTAEGRVVPRVELYRRVWGYRSTPQGRAADFAVMRLRRKLSPGGGPSPLVTVRGQGFRLEQVERVLPAAPGLPALSGPLIGRTADLQAVTAALADGSVSLIGAPGVGKTRLALQMAHESDARWVNLAGATSKADVIERVAAGLGLSLPSQGDRAAALAQSLGPTPVILDECEGAIDALAALVRTWPSVLCTSRRPVAGTRVVDLQPLESEHAVALLTLRAREAGVEPEQDLTALANALDGLPLALELAAARLRTLSPDQLMARLDQRLELLRGGKDRHATLRTALDASWAMLDGAQRNTLVAATTFRGGFQLEALEALYPDALDPLEHLVEHGLVRVRRRDMRFSLLESIRSWGGDHQERDPALPQASRLRTLHSEWFARLGGDDCRRGLHGADRRKVEAELERELANLRHAAKWEEAPVGCTLALVIGLSRHGSLDQRLDSVRAVKLRYGGPQLARLLLEEGRLLRMKGQPAACLPLLTRSWELADEPGFRALLDLHIGWTDPSQRESRFNRALETYTRIGDDAGRADALSMLGRVRMTEGALSEARCYLESGLALTRRAGNQHVELITLGRLAPLVYFEGDTAGAVRVMEQALNLARRRRDPVEHVLLGNRGWLRVILGQPGGIEDIEAALDGMGPAYSRPERAIATANLGRAYAVKGQIDLANTTLLQAEGLAGGDLKARRVVAQHRGDLCVLRGLSPLAAWQDARELAREAGEKMALNAVRIRLAVYSCQDTTSLAAEAGPWLSRFSKALLGQDEPDEGESALCAALLSRSANRGD